MRKSLILLSAALSILVATFLFTGQGFAGDAAAPVLEATPLLDAAAAAPDAGTEIAVKDPAAQLIGFILVALGALLKWGADKLFGTGGKVPLNEDMHRLLDQAIDAAAQLAREKLVASLKDMENPVVQNKTVATALNFVLAAVPTVVDALGITEEALEAKLRAKLFRGRTVDAADA